MPGAAVEWYTSNLKEQGWGGPAGATAWSDKNMRSSSILSPGPTCFLLAARGLEPLRNVDSETIPLSLHGLGLSKGRADTGICLKLPR